MNVLLELSTYRTLAQLGEGGNGVVYLTVAHGPGGIDKLVVLKELKRNVDTSELREQLLSEARVAVLLNHPNVIQTFGVTVREGQPVIIMEFLDGRALHQLREKAWKVHGSMPFPISLKIVRDLLRGLHHAHELTSLDGRPLGLVHRDITPQNVIVTFDGIVKVLDFGIAKTSASVMHTARGLVKGKLRYMSPEQFVRQLLDRRSDVFSVGVILWELLTNQRMWAHASDTEVMNALRTGQLRSPWELNPAVPAELERICMKALARNPNQRYATAAELQAELDALGGLATDQELARFVSDLFWDDRVNVQALLADSSAEQSPGPLQKLPASFGQPALPSAPPLGPASAVPDPARREDSGTVQRTTVPVQRKALAQGAELPSGSATSNGARYMRFRFALWLGMFLLGSLGVFASHYFWGSGRVGEPRASAVSASVGQRNLRPAADAQPASIEVTPAPELSVVQPPVQPGEPSSLERCPAGAACKKANGARDPQSNASRGGSLSNFGGRR